MQHVIVLLSRASDRQTHQLRLLTEHPQHLEAKIKPDLVIICHPEDVEDGLEHLGLEPIGKDRDTDRMWRWLAVVQRQFNGG